MGFMGLDVVAIRHLSRQLDIQSQEVNTAAKNLTNLIANTEWFGLDSRQFAEAWQANRMPELQQAAKLLAEASQLATRGASKQENASRG